MSAAVALAGAGALGYGIASVLQSAAARGRTGTLGTLVRPAYLAGTALDLLAWCCSLLALRSLPVFEVQSVLACSLAITALAAWAVLGVRLGRSGLLAVSLSIVAVVVLAAGAGPQHPVTLPALARDLLAVSVLPVSALGMAAARAGWVSACAGLAGVAFGGAALCARAVSIPPRPLGDLGASTAVLAADPLVWALAGFGVTGMLLYATALERGDAARVTALLWLCEVAVPSVVGVVLLGDAVRPGWGAEATGAVALSLVAVGLLSRSTAPSPREAGPGFLGPARIRPEPTTPAAGAGRTRTSR